LQTQPAMGRPGARYRRGYRIAQPVFDGTVVGQKGSETVTDDFAFRGVLTFGHLCTNKIAFARD